MGGLDTGKWVISLEELGSKRSRESKREGVGNRGCGGKAVALGLMLGAGLKVPSGLCVSTAVYEEYVEKTGLQGRILLDLSRKPLEEMRWEELWDLSEKLKNMFSRTPLPLVLERELGEELEKRFDGRPVAVRSSAPGEDSAKTSFAGVHESYVNIRGLSETLRHLRLVWASLWSDTALLYRKEMGLDVFESSMAVLVQEIIEGRASGVVFGMNPENESEAVVEAVYGLNKGLVDGAVEPDRWILGRDSGAVKNHRPAAREKAVFGSRTGTEIRPLPLEMKKRPPISQKEVREVYSLVREAEKLFHAPQDVEWTFRDGDLYALQSRPITTLRGQDRDEKRLWYLSLRRSFENLQELRKTIEDRHIPALQAEAKELEKSDLSRLLDPELAEEIERRGAVYRKWHDIYWDEFIPFAHGARLFGQVYNEKVNPGDPYEFLDLLSGTEMLSLERNRKLESLATSLRESRDLRSMLQREGREQEGRVDYGEGQEGREAREYQDGREGREGREGQESPESQKYQGFIREVDAFLSKFGGSYSESPRARAGLFKLLLEMASVSPSPVQAADMKKAPERIKRLKENYISGFDPGQSQFAADLLALGRASYRLRDDDNIHLGKIEAEVQRALLEGRGRLLKRGVKAVKIPEIEMVPDFEFIKDMAKSLRNCQSAWAGVFSPGPDMKEGTAVSQPAVSPRQLPGNPSGPGSAEGYARVILKEGDLFEFRAGEVLVCDAVDPNMTFVVPLCAAIVERRGGVLIHGAIIAREYGIPCVTGVSEAARLINNGDYLAVDGYLGIVTILKRRE